MRRDIRKSIQLETMCWEWHSGVAGGSVAEAYATERVWVEVSILSCQLQPGGGGTHFLLQGQYRAQLVAVRLETIVPYTEPTALGGSWPLHIMRYAVLWLVEFSCF